MSSLIKIQDAQQLCEITKTFSERSWVPATSSNFSFLVSEQPLRIAITISGVDKTQCRPGDLMVVDSNGKAINPAGVRPSAETLLHTLLYENHGAGAVFHTHSMSATLLSQLDCPSGKTCFEGLEILKALEGNRTHAMTETLPIFENTQEMPPLAEKVDQYLRDYPQTHGFLIAGHGLYTWGKTMAAAKRHIEAFEFLMEWSLKARQLWQN